MADDERHEMRDDRDERDRDDRDSYRRSVSPDRYDRRSPSPRRNGADEPQEFPKEDDEEAKNEGTNLFVTGLSRSVTEEELEEMFAKHGAVDKVQVMVDPHTRDSRGFGFVNMSDTSSASNAIAEINGRELGGKVISVEYAKRKRPRTPTPGKYFGPPKPRRRFAPRYDDRYQDRYGSRPRYDDRYDDSYRRPYRYDDQRDSRDRYYRDRGYSSRYDDRGDRYGPPPPPPRDYRDRERYDRSSRDERDRPPPPRDYRDEGRPPYRESRGYSERDDYRA
jgi:transformer-2 protein